MKTKLLFYLMLLLGLNGYAQTINVSTGVNALGNALTVGTVDPLWQIVSSPNPAGTSAKVTTSFSPTVWEPTPVATTNANLINASANCCSNAPGDYTFERSFTVPAGTASFSCDFKIAFDDTLLFLELVKPDMTTVPLTVVPNPISNYRLSSAITNTISSPMAGTWKIRAKLNFYDSIAFYMLSGYINIPNSSTTCSTTASDFNSLYTGLASNTAIYNDHTSVDLQVHSYTFNVSSQKTICSIGYKAQPELAARTYEIKITEVGSGAVLYDGFHIFSTTAQRAFGLAA